jgi:hypothetical protein
MAGAQAVFLLPKAVRIGGSESARPIQLRQKPAHIMKRHQFFHEFAGSHEARISIFPEKPIPNGAGIREKPACDICINY